MTRDTKDPRPRHDLEAAALAALEKARAMPTGPERTEAMTSWNSPQRSRLAGCAFFPSAEDPRSPDGLPRKCAARGDKMLGGLSDAERVVSAELSVSQGV
jgi:hypothetical protein